MGGVLAFVPDANRVGLSDVTAAFLPAALEFLRHHGADSRELVRFPANTKVLGDRRRVVLDALEKQGKQLKPSTIAFFCHGYKDGIQAGFSRPDVAHLADVLSYTLDPDAFVLLYACDTGRNGDQNRTDDTQPGPGGDGGFADALRDALERLGRRVTVMAHTTEGHSVYNPHARRFAPGTGGTGGQWYIEPGSPLWGRWREALRAPGNMLRFRFPRMSSDAIAEELRARLV